MQIQWLKYRLVCIINKTVAHHRNSKYKLGIGPQCPCALIHTQGHMQTFFSLMSCPIHLKLHMGTENCRRQRLTELFVSFTHCLCQFWWNIFPLWQNSVHRFQIESPKLHLYATVAAISRAAEDSTITKDSQLTQDPPLYTAPVVWNGIYTSHLLSGRSHISHGDSEEPPSLREVLSASCKWIKADGFCVIWYLFDVNFKL